MITGLKKALFFVAACLLVAGSSLADDEVQRSSAPTPFDMVALLAAQGDMNPMELANQIFDMGMLVNMRVPMEHLRVRFVDTTTGNEIGRDERRQILGQSRQDWSHALIHTLFENFPMPSGTSAATMMDIFDAAAFASMRIPPETLAIEFYDVRTGPTGKTDGGVSGRVPDYVYVPSTSKLIEADANENEGVVSQQPEVDDLAARARQIALADQRRREAEAEARFTPDRAYALLIERAVDNGDVFMPESDAVFLSPFYAHADSEAEFLDRVRQEARRLESQRRGWAQMGRKPIDINDPFVAVYPLKVVDGMVVYGGFIPMHLVDHRGRELAENLSDDQVRAVQVEREKFITVYAPDIQEQHRSYLNINP
ncbi:hypothetical protein [Desulfurispira natronophila]|uniref:Uncharacterized protein n=1 Tax=Desulfurispira natronophila TaxID=682562 RepID=A0A7W8DGF1_9BACT|nr:hypothetical protein [Desulfurispira natronophila]MBB5021345.1 hypothetical protein [Desulfurispira natronophila]